MSSPAPNAAGSIHSHPWEQWGLMLEGSGVRHPVVKGDLRRTPGAVVCELLAGADGGRLLDVCAPPRDACRPAGSGLGNG